MAGAAGFAGTGRMPNPSPQWLGTGGAASRFTPARWAAGAAFPAMFGWLRCWAVTAGLAGPVAGRPEGAGGIFFTGPVSPGKRRSSGAAFSGLPAGSPVEITSGVTACGRGGSAIAGPTRPRSPPAASSPSDLLNMAKPQKRMLNAEC